LSSWAIAIKTLATEYTENTKRQIERINRTYKSLGTDSERNAESESTVDEFEARLQEKGSWPFVSFGAA
jgi:hypothetical protein